MLNYLGNSNLPTGRIDEQPRGEQSRISPRIYKSQDKSFKEVYNSSSQNFIIAEETQEMNNLEMNYKPEQSIKSGHNRYDSVKVSQKLSQKFSQNKIQRIDSDHYLSNEK